jgi:hypothetical protein
VSRRSAFADLSAPRAQLLFAKAVEPETDEEALALAHVVYWQSRGATVAEADGADNLERVAALAAALASELNGETPCSRAGRLRLVAERSKWDNDRTVPVCEREDAVADQLDGLIDNLDALTEAATKAHQQSHGNQRKKDLRAAYDVLAAYWRRTRPEIPITASFVNGEPKRGTAADWLLATLRRIDPARDRLVPELKELVTKDAANTPGPRRGRGSRLTSVNNPVSNDLTKVTSLGKTRSPRIIGSAQPFKEVKSGDQNKVCHLLRIADLRRPLIQPETPVGHTEKRQISKSSPADGE